MNIQEFRQKYPEYGDMDDVELTTSFHEKYYKDIPFDQFHKDFTGRELPNPYNTTLGKIAKAPQDVVVGAAEATATLLTAPTAWMLGKMGKWVGTGVAGLMGDEKPSEFGKYYEEQIASKLTYTPKTELGKGAVNLAMKPIEKFVEYARKPEDVARMLGATEEVSELTGDTSEIGAFGLTALIPRLRPLVKSKPEAFNLAKKIGEAVEDIKDPVERARFVDNLIKEATATGRDPWELLERGVAIPEVIPETKLPASKMIQEKGTEPIVLRGEKQPPQLAHTKGIEIGEARGEPTAIETTVKFTTEIEKIRFDELLNKPDFLWAADDKAFYNRMLEGTKESKLKIVESSMGRKKTTPDQYIANREKPYTEIEILEKEGRTFKDVLSDINTVMGKERGSISGKELSPEAREALDRLKIDYKTLEGKAREAGLSIRQYLINEGVDVATASLVADSSPKTILAPKPVMGIQDFLDASRKEADKISKTPIRDTFVKLIVDKHGNVKRELGKTDAKGKEATENFELIKGSRGYAGDVFATVDKEVWKGLKRTDEVWLDDIHMLRRALAIWEYKPEYKFGEYGREQVMQYLENLKSQLGEKRFNDLWSKSDKLFELTDQKTITRLLEEGLISEQEYNDLAQHKYLPIQWLDKLDPMVEIGIGKDRVSVMSSGLQELKKGEKKLLETRSKKLIFEAVSRVEGRIASNRANKSLYELARDNPDNGVVSIEKKGIEDPVLLGTMIDGERYTFWMDRTLAKEWYKNDMVMNHATAEWIGWLSGAKILKALATGYNPAFILTNIPRDLGLIWMATGEYSAHLPLAMLQMLGDTGKVLPDVIRNGPRVKSFIKRGGSFGFLTHYGKVGGETFKIGGFEGIPDYLSWMGEKSELLTRIALEDRTINNLKKARAEGRNKLTDTQIEKKATAVARGYIDFSEGGELVKMLDVGLPYLNATIQGTRAIMGGAKANPARFTYQTAQIMALASTLYYMNYKYNKDALRSVSDRDKEANWIITTPFKITDDQGQERPFYLKIAKDQGQRIMASMAEALMEKFYEGKFPTNQVWEAWQDFTGVGFSQMIPPTVQAFVGYLNNHDFWTGEQIWKRENIKEAEQWDNRTNPLFKEVSKLGLSPAKTQYFVNRITPMNNPLTSIFTGSYALATGEASKEIQKKGIKQMLLENPTVKRVSRLGDSYNYEKEYIKEQKEDSTTNMFVITRGFDDRFDTFMREPNDNNKAAVLLYMAKVAEKDSNEGARLEKRLERSIDLWKIPDRRWWINTAELKPEARANAFWMRFSKASKKEQDEMIVVMDKVSGYSSERFQDALEVLIQGTDTDAKKANRKNEEELKHMKESEKQ